MITSAPDFFSDPDVIADSRSYFDLMRSQGPIKREVYHGTLMVTGFAEALEILNDKTGLFSNACSVVGPIPGLPFTPRAATFVTIWKRTEANCHGPIISSAWTVSGTRSIACCWEACSHTSV